MANTTTPKIGSLQGLRMILFLTIFASHLGTFTVLKNSTVFRLYLSQGTGALAVSYFFVLSGFVASISQSGMNVVSKKTYWEYLKKRWKKFYHYHWFFLLAAIPLNYHMLVHNTKSAIIQLIYSATLMQSWNSNPTIYFGYNGVAWFLSTSLFLTACTPIIYKIRQKIPSDLRAKLCYIIIALCLFCMPFLASVCRANEQYWLYIFPPSRLLDYLAGYALAEIYNKQIIGAKVYHRSCSYLFVISAMLLYPAYPLIFGHIDIRFSYAAVFLPGSLLTIWAFVYLGGVYKRCFQATY